MSVCTSAASALAWVGAASSTGEIGDRLGAFALGVIDAPEVERRFGAGAIEGQRAREMRRGAVQVAPAEQCQSQHLLAGRVTLVARNDIAPKGFRFSEAFLEKERIAHTAHGLQRVQRGHQGLAIAVFRRIPAPGFGRGAARAHMVFENVGHGPGWSGVMAARVIWFRKQGKL